MNEAVKAGASSVARHHGALLRWYNTAAMRPPHCVHILSPFYIRCKEPLQGSCNGRWGELFPVERPVAEVWSKRKFLQLATLVRSYQPIRFVDIGQGGENARKPDRPSVPFVHPSILLFSLSPPVDTFSNFFCYILIFMMSCFQVCSLELEGDEIITVNNRGDEATADLSIKEIVKSQTLINFVRAQPCLWNSYEQ